MNASQTKASFVVCNQVVGGKESELPENEGNDDKEQMQSGAENVHLSLFWNLHAASAIAATAAAKNIYADMKCIATRNVARRKNTFRVR
jgi:hypothetical protein